MHITGSQGDTAGRSKCGPWQGLDVIASAKCEPIMGVQGAEPPVGSQGAKPPEAECFFFYFACPKEAANLSHTPITDNGNWTVDSHIITQRTKDFIVS